MFLAERCFFLIPKLTWTQRAVAHRVTLAWLQRAPERLLLREAYIAQRQAHFTDRIIPCEAVVVKYLQVECPPHQLVERKTCNSTPVNTRHVA